MATDSEIQTAQIQTNAVELSQQWAAGETRAPASTSDKPAREPDLLKQLVRMIFEQELRRIQALAAGPEASPSQAEPESIDIPLRKLLGKHYPEVRSRSRWRLAQFTRHSHLLVLRIHSMQALYRLLFVQALEEEDLSLEETLRMDKNELRGKLGAAFCRNLQIFHKSSKVRTGTIDQLDKALAWFDRQIQAWLEWCVSLLPYHAPALGEQDPQAILVRAARR